MLSRFHLIPKCHGQTDKRANERTDIVNNCYINIACQCGNAR